MNKYAWKHFVGCMALVLLASCGGQKEEHNEKEGVETVLPEQLNEVTVVKLLPQTFHHELVSNGKVSAREHADLYFRTAEVVAKVYVKNGDFVRKGQKLKARDLIGTVQADESGNCILHFQLRKETTKLNPEAWIGR